MSFANDLFKSSNSLFLQTCPKYIAYFVTFIEKFENETVHYYFHINRSRASLKALKKDLNYDNLSDYKIDFEPLCKKEIDEITRVPQKDIFHVVVGGNLIWKEKIENYVLLAAKDDVSGSIISNCCNQRSDNNKYFESFDTQPNSYIIFSGKDENKSFWKQTAIQYNGNEPEIEKFLEDFRRQSQYKSNFDVGKIVEQPLEVAYVITGKFNYSSSVNKKAVYKRSKYIKQALNKGGIKNFLDENV